MAKRLVKEEIVAVARELFLRMGFKRVSVGDVCERAQVSRKTFYVYFDNKSALIEAVVTDFFAESWALYHEIMASEASIGEKIERIMAMKVMMSESMSMEFLTDLYSTDDQEVQRIYQANVQKAMVLMVDFYKGMQADGLVSKEIKMEVLFAFQNKILEMCQDVTYRAQFESVEMMVKHTIGFFMNGILLRK